jgi:hypothetical protein
VIVIIFILLIAVSIYFKVRYNQAVTKAQASCISNKLDIFGVTYENASDIHKDFNFMSKLWSGNAIKGVSNEALKLELLNARKLLQLQLLFGFLTFLSVVINGFVSA